MRNSTLSHLDEIAECRSDLLANGLDLAHMDDPQIAGLVKEHLEYFQMMLGEDLTPRQVLRLIHEDLAAVGGIPS